MSKVNSMITRIVCIRQADASAHVEFNGEKGFIVMLHECLIRLRQHTAMILSDGYTKSG